MSKFNFADLLKLLRKDANWGSNPTIGQFLLIPLVVFGCYVILLSIIYPTDFRLLIREDGAVEYASALFWLLAAIFVIIKYVFFNKGKIQIWDFLLLIFFIACVGEEISWGQRIFHFSGPSEIIGINKQHEFNLHDIGHISIFSNAFFLIFVCYFFLFPYLVFKYEKVRVFAEKVRLPVVRYEAVIIALITIVIWLVIGIRFGTLGFHPYTLFGYYTQMDDEIFELLAAYSYLSFMVLEINFKNCRLSSGQNH